MKKKILLGVGILVVIFFVVVANSDDSDSNVPPLPSSDVADAWAEIRANDVPVVHEEGWGAPQYLAVNDGFWEDGVFISPDGDEIYFTYYPEEDFLAAAISGEFVDDLDVYVTKDPFTSKKKFSKFYFSEDIWSEGGTIITPDGDIFYQSNRDYINDQSPDDDIYLNNERLAFNDDGWAGNPHYCSTYDELYFDERDERIWVLRDAAANGFDGEPEVLSGPINRSDGVPSFQPFLSEDCETMYFTTGGPNGPAIFKSTRDGNGWGQPTLFISSGFGIGEFTMTTDETKATFLQVFRAPDGRFTSDIFLIEKE